MIKSTDKNKSKNLPKNYKKLSKIVCLKIKK